VEASRRVSGVSTKLYAISPGPGTPKPTQKKKLPGAQRMNHKFHRLQFISKLRSAVRLQPVLNTSTPAGNFSVFFNSKIALHRLQLSNKLCGSDLTLAPLTWQA